MPQALEEDSQGRLNGQAQIGRVIGSYRITRPLGSGGMGAVFEVEHQNIGQRAAVKILHPEHANKKKLVERFFDEARAISAVQHPGLVKVFDYARLDDGTVYILMELLQGESLWDRFTRLRSEETWLPLEQVLRLSRQLASTLAAVHQKGIIHRDLKPENVVIVPDPEAMGGERAKILDFGIAKFAEHGPGSTRRTTAGMVLGTPLYMSPEQCRGDDVLTDKSDVYSLGVMIYEMLAGSPPFDNAQGGMIMASHIFREPPSLRALPHPPPEGVSQLVEEMLAKETGQRPSMAVAVSRLEALGVSTSMPVLRLPTGGFAPLGPGGAQPVTAPIQLPRPSAEQVAGRRVPLLLLVGLPALLLGGMGTFFLLRPSPHAPQVSPPPPVVAQRPPRQPLEKLKAPPAPPPPTHLVSASATSGDDARPVPGPEVKPEIKPEHHGPKKVGRGRGHRPRVKKGGGKGSVDFVD